jgi:hypothetical protein
MEVPRLAEERWAGATLAATHPHTIFSLLLLLLLTSKP